MYHKILVPLENGPADQTILEHVQVLAKMTGASLVLLHVADGWVARNYSQLNLADSEEMVADRAYLQQRMEELQSLGFSTEQHLRMGEPWDQIVKLSVEEKVDLIAMATHGHRFIRDLINGNTADKVRHRVDVPVLMLKSPHST